MRKAITISLPDNLLKIVDAEVSSENFPSRSLFFQILIRHWQKCENQQRLINEAKFKVEMNKWKWKISMRDA